MPVQDLLRALRTIGPLPLRAHAAAAAGATAARRGSAQREARLIITCFAALAYAPQCWSTQR